MGLKERSSGLSIEGKRSTGLSSEGRDPLVTQADLSAPRVCSSAIALLHKKGPCHRRKIGVNSLWLYSYYTQSSLSKNKNINYIFYISTSFLLFLQRCSILQLLDNPVFQKKSFHFLKYQILVHISFQINGLVLISFRIQY